MNRQLTEQRGFTLIELLVTVAIIAVIAVVAVPNLVASKGVANETAAIATLRHVHTAETDCANRKFIDMDADGVGEFGFFAEMSGGIPPRNTVGISLLPPLLASSFQNVQNGIVSRQGYLFAIYLPDLNGAGLSETAAGFAGVDADAAEVSWCCYAWPSDAGNSGRRAFFINQMGELLFTDNAVQQYSGAGLAPPPDAVFPAGSGGAIDGRYVTGAAASDGGTWTTVSP